MFKDWGARNLYITGNVIYGEPSGTGLKKNRGKSRAGTDRQQYSDQRIKTTILVNFFVYYYNECPFLQGEAMKKLINVAVIIITAVMMINAQTDTIVLQQGFNGYNGCQDKEIRDSTKNRFKPQVEHLFMVSEF